MSGKKNRPLIASVGMAAIATLAVMVAPAAMAQEQSQGQQVPQGPGGFPGGPGGFPGGQGGFPGGQGGRPFGPPPPGADPEWACHGCGS